MALEQFLASTFFLNESLVGITDVQDIIDELDIELKTVNNPVWTEPSADRFKSPVDVDGRFMEMLFVRDSAVVLSCEAFDQNGVSIMSRSFEIAATDSCKIYSGQHHLYISALTGGTAAGEGAYIVMSELSPAEQTVSGIFVQAAAKRTSAGATDASDESTETFQVENGTPAVRVRAFNMGPADNGGGANLIYADGSPFFIDALTLVNPSGSTKYGGRMYQAYLVADGNAFNARIKIPVDDGTLGEFDVTYEDPAATGDFKLAFRSNS